jgi:molecular chaperone HscC
MRLVWADTEYRHVVTAAAFEEAAKPLLDRLREPVLRSMRDSGLKSADLSEIILIGGATRMPLVRGTVTRMFGRFPNATVNPDEAVALGAAVQAGLKSRDSALKEVVVTDVCPYSLGVEVARRLPGGGIEDGLFAPIIERGTVIPASRVHSFSTMSDNQTKVEMGIFQGEARRVADNVEIGRTSVKMPRGPAGQAIDVRFSYDVSGLLEVDIIVPKTGETVSLTINDGSVSDPAALAQARAGLAALKTHPRDEAENRAAIARGEKCYENYLGHQREWVGEIVASFTAALDTQDPRVIETARKELHAALDSLEGETFL